MSSVEINDEDFLDAIWEIATEVGCICKSNGYFEQLDSGEVTCIECSEVVFSLDQAKELKERYKKSNET